MQNFFNKKARHEEEFLFEKQNVQESCQKKYHYKILFVFLACFYCNLQLKTFV